MEDLTTGSITRHLIKTASFMLVTMVFQTLYLLIDLYWVGRLGKEAVAAVAIAGNLTFVVLAVTQMLGVGTTALVSHAVGRKDQDRALLVFNQSLVLSTLVGLIFLGLSLLLLRAYTSTLGADSLTADLARDYLLWYLPAMSLQYVMAAMAAALRGSGNFKPGMVVQTASVIINMVLAPFLIFGWATGVALGVGGAALSSFVAVLIGTVWLATYFLNTSTYLHFTPARWQMQFPLWGQMLKIGLPAGAEFGLMAVYLFIVYAVSRPFGSAAQAGFGIGLRIVQSGFMPVVALGFAVAPVAGQNVGARLPDRVKKTFVNAASLAALAMVIWGFVCRFGAAPMVRFFSDDPQVVAVGSEYLQIMAWTFVASGVIFVSSSMFQALGNTIPSLAASFARIVLVAIPAVLLARMPGFELHWIWYLSVGSVIFQVLTVLLLLRREFRLRLPSTATLQVSSATVGTS
jgi:putative MATE family efflux protein